MPVGRLDALLWLSVVPIIFLMGLALQNGMPPDAYLRGNQNHTPPKMEHFVPSIIENI